MIISDQLGEPMKKRTRPTFSPEFRLEASQLVVDQNYTVIAAAKAMNVGIFFFYWDTEPDIYSHYSTALKLGKY